MCVADGLDGAGEKEKGTKETPRCLSISCNRARKRGGRSVG